jgi:two-component system phosphate regulon response regulator PhoB
MDDGGVALPRVLVCDDERVMRSLVRATLDGVAEVVEASDGDEALALLREARPALLIVDMMMPGMSGLEVVRRLRGDGQLRALPVIMITARVQIADRETALEAGVDLFIGKPFSPSVLLDAVRSLLERAGDAR